MTQCARSDYQDEKYVPGQIIKMKNMCQVSAMFNVQCARSVQGQARSNEPAVGTPLQGEIFFSEQVFCSSGNCPPLMQSNLGDIHDFTTYHQMSTKEPQM